MSYIILYCHTHVGWLDGNETEWLVSGWYCGDHKTKYWRKIPTLSTVLLSCMKETMMRNQEEKSPDQDIN